LFSHTYIHCQNTFKTLTRSQNRMPVPLGGSQTHYTNYTDKRIVVILARPSCTWCWGWPLCVAVCVPLPSGAWAAGVLCLPTTPGHQGLHKETSTINRTPSPSMCQTVMKCTFRRFVPSNVVFYSIRTNFR